MSIEQKRLQLPTTKFSDVVVGLANPGWQTVPEPWSSGCEAPIAEPVCVRGTQLVSMSADGIRSADIDTCDGRRERQAGSRLQDMLQLHRATHKGVFFGVKP